MDKYEYKLHSEEIVRLIEEEKYDEAVRIADIIDWRKVKSVSMLLRIAALYRVNRRNEDSRDVLQLAYYRYPTNRSVVYSLCEVSIELDDVVAAIEYYKEFVKLAPRDNGVYTLRYRILEAQEANLEERIALLEEFKKRDYQEEWAYELAYLYHRVGLGTKCVEECDDLILWFGDGTYVMQAMELKMLHAPLTAVQEKKYQIMQSQLQGVPVDEAYASDYEASEYMSSDYEVAEYAEESSFEELQNDTGVYSQEYDELAQMQENNYLGQSYTDAPYAQEQKRSFYTQPMPTTQYEDMSQYNTINLQKVVAESMRELFPDDEDIYAENKREIEMIESASGRLSQEAMQEYNEPVMQEIIFEDVESDESGSVVLEEELPIEELMPEEQEQIQEPIPVPSYVGKVSALVTGVSEVAPDPLAGAISRVIVPGNDARMIQQDMEIEEVRTMPEEVQPQETVYQEEEEVPFRPMTGQMNIEDVLLEWERMKKENEEKRKDQVRQLVLQQTGPIFESFNQSIKTGILGEMFENEEEVQTTHFRSEVFLEDDETDEIEELEDIEDTETLIQEETLVEENLTEESFIEEEMLIENEMIFEETEGTEEEMIDAEAESMEEAPEFIEEEAVYEESEFVEEEAVYEESEFMEEEAVYEESEFVEEEAVYEESAFIEEAMYEETDLMEEAAYEEAELIEENQIYEEEETESAQDSQFITGESQQEEAEENLLKTQEMSMNTAEISSLPEKIIAATKKETRGVQKDEPREFTSEEQELFENFAVTKKIKKQILYALDNMTLASYTGNVIISGEKGLGTVRIAKNLIREFKETDANFSGKAAKITGEQLNTRDLKETFDKLKNGAIIIEEANGLSENTLYQMATLLNQDDFGLIVFMEDTKKGITKLLEKQAMIADYFNIRIDLVEMDNNALVAYAKMYAQELEYSIDEMGVLALYTRIANIQSGNHIVTKDEVREIVDEAIWNSRRPKIKNFVDVLLSKRYDKDDMIVLKERDFI